MELFYYLMVREDVKYETWRFIDINVITDFWSGTPHHVEGEEIDHPNVVGRYSEGWTKLPMPKDITKDEQLDWYIQSNKEDLHFIFTFYFDLISF